MLDIANIKKRGSKIHQIDKIVHHAWTRNFWPCCQQSHPCTKVVQIAFSSGEPRCTMVAADNHQCVVELTGIFQYLENDADIGIERLSLTKVIGEVFADFRNIG